MWIATRVAVFATPLIYVAVLLDVWRIRCNFLAQVRQSLRNVPISHYAQVGRGRRRATSKPQEPELLERLRIQPRRLVDQPLPRATHVFHR